MILVDYSKYTIDIYRLLCLLSEISCAFLVAIDQEACSAGTCELPSPGEKCHEQSNKMSNKMSPDVAW